MTYNSLFNIFNSSQSEFLSREGAPPEEARCKVLSGWLRVSQWRGLGAVDHYDFCSFSCLQEWVAARES